MVFVFVFVFVNHFMRTNTSMACGVGKEYFEKER